MPYVVFRQGLFLAFWGVRKVAEVGSSCALAAGQRKFDRQMERVWGEDGRGGANMDREHSRNGPGGVPPPHGGGQMHPMAASAGLQMPAGSGHMVGPVGVPMGGPPGQWAVPQQYVPGQPFMPMVPGARSSQGLKFLPLGSQLTFRPTSSEASGNQSSKRTGDLQPNEDVRCA